MKVCDLMHKGVISCYADDALKDVANMMEQNDFRSAVVVNEQGEVWGIITHREIIPQYGKHLEKIRAGDVMRPYRVEVDPQWPIEKAIELMKKLRYYHLIVVDPHVGTKWPVGMLTSFDIVRHLARIEAGQFEQVLKLSGDE